MNNFLQGAISNLFLTLELIDPPVLPFVPFSSAWSKLNLALSGPSFTLMSYAPNHEEVSVAIWILLAGYLPYTATVHTWKAPVWLYSALFRLFFGLPWMTFLSQGCGRCCQLSQVMRETPDFEPYLPVSRLESEISLIITKVCHFL